MAGVTENTLGLETPAATPVETRLPDREPRSSQGSVEVAVDAPGATRTYDYSVPSRLVPIEPGEAVLVEFGRRQALGVVLGPSTGLAEIELKPLLARVHADGPLLPPLTLSPVPAFTVTELLASWLLPTAPFASWLEVTLPAASIVLVIVPAPMFAGGMEPVNCPAATLPVTLFAVMA